MRELTSALSKRRWGSTSATMLGDELQAINLPGFGFEGGAVLLANFAFAQVIEAEIGDNPVKPGGETAIEAELGRLR